MMPNDYDRVLKENIGRIFIPLSEKYLGFKIVKSRSLTGKLQHTLEREPDFVKVVETPAGEEFILHLEFQLQNEVHMLRRMRLYHALLEEKYRLAVRQFVLYLGPSVSTMRTWFNPDEVMTGFEMVDIPRMDVDLFLSSEVPEEVLLAVLANFENRDPQVVIRLIMQKLKGLGEDEAKLRRWLKQLGILARIPKLESIYKKSLSIMPFNYNVQEDGLFLAGKEEGIAEGKDLGLKEGLEEGLEKARVENAIKMLKAGTLSIAEVVDFSGLSTERVIELQNQLKA